MIPPLLTAWIVMLLLGAIAHIATQPRLAISYWLTLLICWVLKLLL